MHPLDIHWIYTLGSVALIAALSFIGMLAISIGPQRLSRIIPIMVSLAAGALLGTAFGHLLPESIERVGAGRELAGLLLFGFVTFFVLEKVLALWCNRNSGGNRTIHHDHSHLLSKGDAIAMQRAPSESSGPMITNLLVGAGIHSFVDGMAIATGYITNTHLGVTTTIAVLLYETPHHIGDVSILMHKRLPVLKAVLLNLIPAAGGTVGALIILFVGARLADVSIILLPFATANFLYVASANLMPELQREGGMRHSFTQIVLFLAGSLLMFASFGGPEPR